MDLLLDKAARSQQALLQFIKIAFEMAFHVVDKRSAAVSDGESRAS